jgi:hypothetical protein
MKWFDLFLGAMLVYLIVYGITCYYVYIKPKNDKSTGNKSRPIIYQKTYCSPAFLFPTNKKLKQ